MSVDLLSRQYEGRLDVIGPQSICGWVRDRNSPDPVFVVVYIDGRRLCLASANLFRGDLLKNGKGDGYCAYRVPIPEQFWDGKEHDVCVSVPFTSPDFIVGSATARFGLTQQTEAQDLEGADMTARRATFFCPSEIQHFRKNTREARALIGKNGWLFLSDDSNRTRDQLQNRMSLSPARLDTFKRVFAERRDRFAKLGIPYVFAVAPTKELIYEDQLPSDYIVDHAHIPMEQVRLALQEEGIDMLLLHKPLLEAKKREPVYYRTDTHWNSFGAYAAYEELVKACARHLPNMTPVPRTAFKTKVRAGYRGDLADKAKVVFVGGDPEVAECAPETFRSELFSEDVVEIYGGPMDGLKDGMIDPFLNVSDTRSSVVKIGPKSDKPRLMVFRDSFMINVIPFLSLNFSRSVYLWKPDPMFSVIAKEQPDIVIHVMLDRFMVRAPIIVD